MEISIWLGNLGAYNRGELRGDWISLPLEQEELQEKIDEILGPIDEECYIGDYECDFPISEYCDVREINEMAMDLQEVDGDALYMIRKFYYSDVKQAIEIAKNGDYTMLHGVKSRWELAEILVDEYDYLGDVPKHLRPYLDWGTIADEIETDSGWKFDESLEKAINLWN